MHDYEERPPVPLSIHHTPVCFTFGLFAVPDVEDEDSAPKQAASSGAPTRDVLVLDPTDGEAVCMRDRMTYAVNAHGELCMVHKVGGAPVDQDDILRYAKVAAARGVTLLAHLSGVLAKAEEVEQKRAMKAHAAAAGYDEEGRLKGSTSATSHAALPDRTHEAGMRIGNSGTLASASGGDAALALSTAAATLVIGQSGGSTK